MVRKAFSRVFKKPAYVALAAVVGFLVFAFAVWLPNFRLIIVIMNHPEASFADKVNLPLSLLGSIATNFTLLSAFYTIAIATLFGINISMLVYLLTHRLRHIQSAGIATGFLGLASGIIGVGCAACGSLILTSLLAMFGSSFVLAFLPLHGQEFGILGVILLLFSIYKIAGQIQNPAVCSVS